jgi:hypothetical protein
MATRNQLKERNVEKVSRDRAPIPWQYFLLSIVCGLTLAFGFFYAAKQHFSTIESSMKNSDMRKAKEKLMAEQRKLKVERDEVSSEAYIEKAGMKIGLRKFSSDDYQFIDATRTVAAADYNADHNKVTADKTKAANDKADLAKVTKTVSVRPAENEKTNRSAKSSESKPVTRDNIAALIAKK